jgi:hypothetical protein
MAKLLVGMESETMEALRRAAAEAGVPMAEIVRRALRAYLRGLPEDPWDRAFRVVGRYAGDAPDVAEHHDRYLEEAYAE